jgi:hypothetical protein
MEDPFFIRLSIEHYRALLATKLGDEARSTVQKLLIDAESALADVSHAARAAAMPRRRAEPSVSR